MYGLCCTVSFITHASSELWQSNLLQPMSTIMAAAPISNLRRTRKEHYSNTTNALERSKHYQTSVDQKISSKTMGRKSVRDQLAYSASNYGFAAPTSSLLPHPIIPSPLFYPMALTNSEIGGNVRYDRKEIRQETPSKMMGRKPFVDRPASPASDRTFATSLLHYLYPWTNPPPPKIFCLTVMANSGVVGYGRTDGSATWSNKSQIWAPSNTTSDMISRNGCTAAMSPSSRPSPS